jgi:hypothetical protein
MPKVQASESLSPASSPGESGTIVVFSALSGAMIAFGISPTKASAVAGLAAAVSPYALKAFVQWRKYAAKKGGGG